MLACCGSLPRQPEPVPQPDPIGRSLPEIAARVIDATGRAVVGGDLFRIHGYAHAQGGSLRWITIPEGVNMVGDEVFDPVQMHWSTTSASAWRSPASRD